jgi:L-aspartate oxidase
MPKVDALIIGSGIAGLSLAIKIAEAFPEKSVCVITKDEELDSNTRFAQGGISAVSDALNDSFEKHISDTLAAGDGLCDEDVVNAVVRSAPEALHELIENGVEFDRDENGHLLLGMEGGHSRRRIVHHKDMTGFQIAVSLFRKAKKLPGIVILAHHVAIDLITDLHLPGTLDRKRSCYGAFVLEKSRSIVEKFISPIVILATGGVGQAYRVTTNPVTATGDGIAMAHRAGAEIRNMEFVQFHPTALAGRDSGGQSLLITEALRGQGAYLRNHRGDRFMHRYDVNGELACRDVVARAIERERSINGQGTVYMDCTHLSSDDLVKHFPQVYSQCLLEGIDITTNLIPVAPAAHYVCGGIAVNLNAETSIKGLYAIGECSFTGLHGANRLASNSLLEAAVFSEFCFQKIKHRQDLHESLPDESRVSNCYSATGIKSVLSILLKEEVQNLMTSHAGIVRTTKHLQHALKYLRNLSEGVEHFYSFNVCPDLIALRNIIQCSLLIVGQSLERKVNKGVFYNRDLENHTVHPGYQWSHF